MCTSKKYISNMNKKNENTNVTFLKLLNKLYKSRYKKYLMIGRMIKLEYIGHNIYIV